MGAQPVQECFGNVEARKSFQAVWTMNNTYIHMQEKVAEKANPRKYLILFGLKYYGLLKIYKGAELSKLCIRNFVSAGKWITEVTVKTETPLKVLLYTLDSRSPH